MRDVSDFGNNENVSETESVNVPPAAAAAAGSAILYNTHQNNKVNLSPSNKRNDTSHLMVTQNHSKSNLKFSTL